MPERENMTVTERRCRELWERLYPEVKKPQTYFRGWYEEAAGPGSAVLDLGAGAGGSMDHTGGAKGVTSVGMDIDIAALKSNESIHHAVAGSSDRLPFLRLPPPYNAAPCRERPGARMVARRIYRGLPTIVLFLVAAIIQVLAISVFA